MQWPQLVADFLLSSDTVVNFSTQFISLDCLITPQTKLKSYYISLIGFSVLPIFGIVISALFWRVRLHKNKTRRHRYLFSTVLIFLFIIHPALTRAFMKSFQ